MVLFGDLTDNILQHNRATLYSKPGVALVCITLSRFIPKSRVVIVILRQSALRNELTSLASAFDDDPAQNRKLVSGAKRF